MERLNATLPAGASSPAREGKEWRPPIPELTGDAARAFRGSCTPSSPGLDSTRRAEFALVCKKLLSAGQEHVTGVESIHIPPPRSSLVRSQKCDG